MMDLTSVIEKPIAIVPDVYGVPSVPDSTITPEAALSQVVKEVMKATGGNTSQVNDAIQAMTNTPSMDDLTMPNMVNRVLSMAGAGKASTAFINQVISNMGLPSSLPAFALSLNGSQGGSLATIPDAWGIYHKSGGLALQVDTIVQVQVAASAKIATHPVQAGAFASFNKVHEPNKITLRLAKSGNKTNGKQMRTEFLKVLDNLKQGLELVEVVTPNAVYSNLNLTGYNYRFEQGGAVSMIIAEAIFDEVREVKPEYTTDAPKNPDGTPAINNPQSVNAASPQSGGMVNPQPVKNDDRNIVQKAADWVIGLFGK